MNLFFRAVEISIPQVGWAKHVLKRAGVRPSMHSLLHFKEAILDHGKSTNENCYRVVSRRAHDIGTIQISHFVCGLPFFIARGTFLTKGR